MKHFPARLQVLLASQSRLAVVLRRGPSRSVCSILWNRKTDEFKVGQWLRGRIYERRCDLSPDGRYLIYFAMNGRWTSETKGSWTAVSKAPWLKAVALWGKGDCWHGGGLFTGERSYWINGGPSHFPLKPSSEIHRDDSPYPGQYRFGGECPGVYYLRLQRDGWKLKPEVSDGDFAVFEKELSRGWLLRKFAHTQIGSPPGKGCYWDEHEMEHVPSGRRVDGAAWEWADLDGRKLVWAEAGCLFRASLKSSGLGERKLLFDFNTLKFEELPAPY